MARVKEEQPFLAEMASTNQYKRSQGRLIRRLTLIALVLVIGLGCWRLGQTALQDQAEAVRKGVPVALAVLGAWASFRLINYPPFADFLIAVEGEMDKVNWASSTYLIRATGVVITVMVVLAACLMVFDLFWQALFRAIGFLRIDMS